jgi:hypothetical protein
MTLADAHKPRTVWQPLVAIPVPRRGRKPRKPSRCESLGVCKGVPAECPKCPNKKIIKLKR